MNSKMRVGKDGWNNYFSHKSLLSKPSKPISKVIGSSKQEKAWLQRLRHVNHWEIIEQKHLRINGRRYRVDGYVEGTQPIVLEFLGCLWHSCPNCYDGGKMYQKTIQRFKDLKNAGYQIFYIWACQESENYLGKFFNDD